MSTEITTTGTKEADLEDKDTSRKPKNSPTASFSTGTRIRFRGLWTIRPAHCSR